MAGVLAAGVAILHGLRMNGRQSVSSPVVTSSIFSARRRTACTGASATGRHGVDASTAPLPDDPAPSHQVAAPIDADKAALLEDLISRVMPVVTVQPFIAAAFIA